MASDKILYHYCSNDKLMNIINSKQLWMSDISRSNDYNEMRLFYPDIFQATEDCCANESFDFQYRDETGFKAIQRLLTDVFRRIDMSFVNGSLTSFVVCFSENKDVLSQWRGYANDGSGCSLGFSRDGLKKYCRSNMDLISLSKVNYLSKEQYDAVLLKEASKIKERIKLLKKEILELFNSRALTDDENDALKMILLYRTFCDFFRASLKYKSDSFKEESEWRLFFNKMSKDETTLYADEKTISDIKKEYDKEWKILHGKVDFYVRDDCLIPYFPMELSEVPIKSFVLGPKNTSHENDVRLLFAKKGLDFPEISRSQISYR